MAASAETDCSICRQIRGDAPAPGGAVYENELVVAFHAYEPELNPTPYLGHLVVEPKRHTPALGELAEAEAAALGVALSRLARGLAADGAEHVYSAILGHHVPHLHVHLVPRYPGTPREYWGPLALDEWPDGEHGGRDEIASRVERLRALV